jgi:hypothetical protein
MSPSTIHEIPTLPSCISPVLVAEVRRPVDEDEEPPTLRDPFGAAATTFFCEGDSLHPGSARVRALMLDPEAEEELDQWWAEQRRRSFVRYVAVTVAICVGVLAFATTPGLGALP